MIKNVPHVKKRIMFYKKEIVLMNAVKDIMNLEKKCLKCGDFCKTCESNEKCEICYDGYYLDGNKCKKCSDNCYTCSKGPELNGNQNYIKCKQDSIYKYLINDENNLSCVDICPESTFLDEQNNFLRKM